MENIVLYFDKLYFFPILIVVILVLKVPEYHDLLLNVEILELFLKTLLF